MNQCTSSIAVGYSASHISRFEQNYWPLPATVHAIKLLLMRQLWRPGEDETLAVDKRQERTA
jgi:hypothetical protein